MKRCLRVLVLATFVVLSTIFHTGCEDRRGSAKMQPVNILWIYTDEQRTDSIGVYDAPIPVKTPNIDSLAARGTVFENHFIQCPVCMPSRTSMLASLYPHQTGVLFNGAGKWPSGVHTFPETFSNAGYVTANIGKSHTPKHSTWQINNSFTVFDEVVGYWDLGPEYDEEEHKILRLSGNRIIMSGIYPETSDGRTHINYAVDSAVEFLEGVGKGNKPFLLRVSLEAPHTPVVVPKEFYDMYDLVDMGWDIPTEQVLESLSRYETEYPFNLNQYKRLKEEEIRRMRASYYALASYVDEHVGRLLRVLDDLNLSDNTVVIYTSDHGCLIGEYAQFQKNKFYDVVTRVPLIIAGPGVPVGKRVTDLTEQVDVGPTLLQLAGIDIPGQFQGQALFGHDYLPKEHVIGEIAPLGVRRSWIRTEKWSMDYTSEVSNKRIESSLERDGKLFDLENDPLQHNNLYYDPSYANIVEELTRTLEERTGEGRIPMHIPSI